MTKSKKTKPTKKTYRKYGCITADNIYHILKSKKTKRQKAKHIMEELRRVELERAG